MIGTDLSGNTMRGRYLLVAGENVGKIRISHQRFGNDNGLNNPDILVMMLCNSSNANALSTCETTCAAAGCSVEDTLGDIHTEEQVQELAGTHCVAQFEEGGTRANPLYFPDSKTCTVGSDVVPSCSATSFTPSVPCKPHCLRSQHRRLLPKQCGAGADRQQEKP